MVRPKIYQHQAHNANFYIHPNFKLAWDIITKLSSLDEDESFIEYVKEVEGEKWEGSHKQGRRGAYIRWILTCYIIENKDKVRKHKLQ